MSSFYSRLALTSSRLIEKYGQSIMLVRPGDSVDPVTGVTTSGSDIRYKLNGILQKYPDNLIDGTRIKSSDRMLILSGEVEPLITDKVTIGSTDWAIESIQTSNPAGTALVYFIQLHR